MISRWTPLVLAAVACAGCAASAALVKRSEARVDSRETMAIMAAKLRPLAPAPLSAWTLADPEIDELEALPGERFLVGSSGVDVTQVLHIAMFSPHYGPYMCLDGRSGEILWSVERPARYDASYAVLTVAPSIVIDRIGKDTRELSALDPATGVRRWTLPLMTTTRLAVSEDSATLVVGAPASGQGMTAIDVITGARRWTVTDTGGPSRLAVIGSALLELGDGVRARDLATGQVLWTSPGAGAGSDRAFPVIVPDGIVVSGAGAVARLGPDGTVRWATPIVGVPSWMMVADPFLLVYAGASDGAGQIVALDLARGKPRWEAPLPGRHHGPFAVRDGRLAFTTGRTLELWELSRGRPIASVALPTAFSEDRLPDHVLVVDGVIAAIGEQGAVGIRSSDGTLVYALAFRGVGDRLFSAADRRARAAAGLPKTGAGLTPGQVAIGATDAATVGPSIVVATAHQNMMAALSHEQYVRETTRGDTSRAASAERLAATQGSLSAVRAAHRAEASAAQSRLVMAIGTASMALGADLGRVLREKERESIVARRRAALDLARRNHQEAVQGQYAVRPVRLKLGDGLLVLDVRTGAWTELPVAPYEGSVGQDAFLDTQLTRIVGSHLVTKGIDLRPEQWQEYEVSVGITTVHRSLLTFDISAVALRPATEYATASTGRASVDLPLR